MPCWPRHTPERMSELRKLREEAKPEGLPENQPSFAQVEACSCEESEILRAVIRVMQEVASGKRTPYGLPDQQYTDMGTCLAVVHLAETALKIGRPRGGSYHTIADLRDEEKVAQLLRWVLDTQ